MLDLNYTKPVILGLFIRRNPDRLSPTAQDLDNLDQQFFNANDEVLETIMQEEEIEPIDPETKSLILAFSQDTSGGTRQVKIRNACRYFKNTQNL